ncbi:MAG: DNA primase [Planctomycetes bacterium]|nr:DNA primase [Planctomycetota bacterium]
MSDLSQTIDAIKQNLPIEQVVGQRVQLSRKGNRLWGLCPFHAEKSPSFSVLPDRDFFKCFGCGKGGDVITFVREIDGLDFIEAVRMLADSAGVEMPERPGGHQADREERDRKKLAREALARARRFYHEALAGPEGAQARAYLEGRQVSVEMIRAFQIGWAPNESNWLSQRLLQAGYEGEVLEMAGLAMRSQRDGSWNDRFRERLMFPVVEAGDRTVGFGGRYLPGSWAEENKRGKYINSPEGPLFPKRRLLYGADKLAQGLREDDRLPILLTEGYLDVILLHQAGMPTAVAALGTAFTEDNARRLRRTKRPVALLLDGDRAGREAAKRAAWILVREGIEVRAVDLPEGADPADLVADGRVEELRERVAKAWDIIDWRLSAWDQEQDLRDPQVKSKAAQELAQWVQATANPVLAEAWQRRICDRLAVSEDALRRLLPGTSPAPEPALPVRPPTPNSNSNTDPAEQNLIQNEREVVEPLLVDPSLFPAYSERLAAQELEDSCAREVLKWCFSQRTAGEDCSLDQALVAFAAHPAQSWLDELRYRRHSQPRSALEAALEALPLNREKVRRPSGSSDDDLRRYLRPGRWSPLDEID